MLRVRKGSVLHLRIVRELERCFTFASFVFSVSFSLSLFRLLVGIRTGVVGDTGRRHYVVFESRTRFLNTAVPG